LRLGAVWISPWLPPKFVSKVENQLTCVTVTVIGDPANPNLSVPFGLVQFFDEVNGGSRKLLGSEQFLTVGNGGNPIFTEQVNLPQGVNVITVRYLGVDFISQMTGPQPPRTL